MGINERALTTVANDAVRWKRMCTVLEVGTTEVY